MGALAPLVPQAREHLVEGVGERHDLRAAARPRSGRAGRQRVDRRHVSGQPAERNERAAKRERVQRDDRERSEPEQLGLLRKEG